MWQKVKNLLYDLIVWSGIVYHVLPLLIFISMRYFFNPEEISNHKEADETGQTLRMTRYNGRNYPLADKKTFYSIPGLKIRHDDVLLCSYPKAGCHWVHEIMHMLVTGRTRMTKLGKEFVGGIDFIPDFILDSVPSPRVLNSHLLYRELPDGVREQRSKIVLMVRNPKDSVVSYFNHHKNLKKTYGYNGNFSAYFKMFMEGRLEYGSYFDYILDWDRVIKESTNNPILLITYEELIEQPMDVVLRIAKHLGLHVTDEFIGRVVDACNFDKIKAVRANQDGALVQIYRKGE